MSRSKKMDAMKDFPPEFTKPFVISFNYIKSCNINFFDDNVPFWQKYWRFTIMIVMVIFNLISMWIYMFRVLGSIGNDARISDIAFMASVCVVGLQSILKAVVLLPKKKDIENLIKGLAMIWKTDNLNHLQVKQKNRRLKQLNFGQSVFYWGTTIAIIQNLVPQLILTVLGKIRQPDYKFILPLGYVYPFDPVMNWGRYLLVYVFQTYTLLRLLFFYLGIHCLLITLCSQLSTEFALLREDIKNASPMPNKSKMSEETNVDKSITIEIIVKQHQELIKLAQLLNYIFNRMVFIDLCFYAIIISFFAVILSVSHDALDKFTNIVTILALLVMVYLFCYYCEMLKEESAGIAESAYENLWYDGGTHYHKTIGFIIMRAQNPCYVMSLNYAPITLNTFTKVVSTTWSYFSLATTMCGTDKE